MKDKIRFAAVLAAGLPSLAIAATTNVTTVADLIGAVRDATSGTEIVVMKSGSPYIFTAGDKDVVGHLYARVRITLRGETDNPDDVVLVGNANRILYLAQPNNVIRNLTFKDGDCSGYDKRTSDPKDQLRGGAIASAKGTDSSTIISNCVFLSCKSSGGGGACGAYNANNAYFGRYFNCRFADNSTTGIGGGAIYSAYSIDGCMFLTNTMTAASANGGAVYSAGEIIGSTFEGNKLTDTGSNSKYGGGAVFQPANTAFASVSISNSSFIANSVQSHCGGAIRSAHDGLIVVNCGFDGNTTVSGNGGALYAMSMVIGCGFTNNVSVSGNGGALSDVSMALGCSIVSNAAYYGGGAFDCVLTGCYMASNYAYRCGAAADSKLYACTNRANNGGGYTELGKKDSSGCYAEDCVFLDAGRGSTTMFGSCGFNRCRFENIKGGRMLTPYVAMTNSLVANGSGFTLFYNLNAASSMVNCTIVSNSYTLTSGSSQVLTAANCFFFGNKIGMTEVDINDSAAGLFLALDNCILSAASNSYIPDYATSGTLNYYGNSLLKPGFVGAAKCPANPFAITRRSPAFNKSGTVQDWMATATDIRGDGYPRLRDGKVNIGCYQCWLNPKGLTISFF